MKKTEVLLGTIPHDELIEFVVKKQDHFPQGNIIKTSGCSCIKRTVMPDGDLSVKVTTRKMLPGEDNKPQSWIIGIETDKANYGVIIRGLLTQRKVKLNP